MSDQSKEVTAALELANKFECALAFICGHVDLRRHELEARIAAEVLAGNQAKEDCERSAMAEICLIEEAISTVRPLLGIPQGYPRLVVAR